MKVNLFILIVISSILSCTIYRSPQRKEFESESPQFRSASAQFRVQNLQLNECTHHSFRSKATSKRLVTVLQNSVYSAHNKIDSEFLWEYLVNDSSVFESDNLKGVYCVYTNS